MSADLIINKHKQSLIDQIVELEENKRELLRDRSLKDLFIFNRYVLKAEAGSESFVPLAPFHKELCHFVTDNKNYYKLILLPRGHLKSKVVTVGYCVQQIIKNPNIRILINNATWQMAVDFLGEIKRQLTTNEALLEIFGNIAEDPIEWSQDRIKLRSSNKKEPTVMAAGIDNNVVASHFDLIINDDVVNRDNASTRDQIDKVIRRYKDQNALLEVGGELIVIGTRWDDKDLYNWILDSSNNVLPKFKTMILPALAGFYWDNSTHQFVDSGQGKILWPEKYQLKNLTDIRRQMGSYDFSTQYMNDPVPDDQATFSRANFQYYDREIVRNKTFNIVTCVDPAISLTKEADYTAFVTVGIDEFTNIYILDIIRKKLNPDQIISEIFFNQMNWQAGVIGVEDVALTKTLGYFLKQEEQRRKKFLPIKPVSPNMRTKFDRIKALQPLYENHKVFHLNNHLETASLEEELTRFPRGAHDDVIDALSYCLDFLYPPKPRSTSSRGKNHYLYSD